MDFTTRACIFWRLTEPKYSSVVCKYSNSVHFRSISSNELADASAAEYTNTLRIKCRELATQRRV
ncbi:hypothetical protein K505DRAFT_4506 [Melanomma pulvis-pyrius CBS 109.77]|uniref:Uncharacterized protein n=1 Tax=Melanomma pulvis-pyrius CBS 109.77 TaxID=1314802 RepID=A0A6A6XJ48_9PLEO|nr:hypothetical protein K505DRAFT_4506 [Melanomma pulvis-pyrius CBS 109.77]